MKFQFLVSLIAILIFQSCNMDNKSKEKAPVLLSTQNNKASCVFLTQDEKNNPVISWTEIDSAGTKHFYFANWDSKSNKFDERISIPIAQNTSIHEEGMPKIAFKGDGTIVATYETSVPSKASRFGFNDIQYVQSFDKGKTWSKPASIQANSTQIVSSSFSNTMRLDDGEIGISWLGTDSDTSNLGRPVMFAKTNGKNGFGPAILIEKSACQCCRTALSDGGNGHISLVFRDLLSNSVRDISVSKSADNGKTFSPSTSFSDDHWVVDGCPHDGPSVVSENGKTFVSWFTGSQNKGVYYAELDKNNKMLHKKQLNPNGRFVQLCLLPNENRLVVFNVMYKQDDSMYNKIILNKVVGNQFYEKEITLPKVHASYPVIKAVNDQEALVAWTDNNKVYFTEININAVNNTVKEEKGLAFSEQPKHKFPILSYDADPVCGMKLNDTMVGDTALSNGKIVGFCSLDCKEKYLKDPKGYVVK